jgi:hypothetical protein
VGKFLDWEPFFMRAGYHARTEKMTMADDLTSPRDRTRISMTEAHEVRYWTKELGISKERVASVLARVGNSAEAVRGELARYGIARKSRPGEGMPGGPVYRKSESAILVMKAAEDRM